MKDAGFGNRTAIGCLGYIIHGRSRWRFWCEYLCPSLSSVVPWTYTGHSQVKIIPKSLSAYQVAYRVSDGIRMDLNGIMQYLFIILFAIFANRLDLSGALSAFGNSSERFARVYLFAGLSSPSPDAALTRKGTPKCKCVSKLRSWSVWADAKK